MKIIVVNNTTTAHRCFILKVINNLRVAIARCDVRDIDDLFELAAAVGQIYEERVRDIFSARRFFGLDKAELLVEIVEGNLDKVIPYLKEVELELELSLR